MRFLCILGIPRTGSMHLAKLLKSCPEFNVKAEVFRRGNKARLTVRELAALGERSDGAVTDLDSFSQWRHDHVSDTLEALYEGGGRRIVTFKMHPGHGSGEALDAALLPRDDIAFAMLARRPIDSYISKMKATALKTNSAVDTTDLKPALSPEDFVEWARKTKRWCALMEGRLVARGTPYARIGYERTLANRSDADALRDVLALLVPLGLTGIEVPRTVKGGERQDRERRYQDRVADWHGFAAALRTEPEHEELLQWARKEPWSQT